MDWSAFAVTLSNSLNQTIHIKTAHALRGGDMHPAYQLQTSIGLLFLKIHHAQTLSMFQTEARSLKAIEQSKSIRCPKVLGVGLHNNEQAWLLLEHLTLRHNGDDFKRGCDLARMHQQVNQVNGTNSVQNHLQTIAPFGWFEDNFIGVTPQKNHWHTDWITFYGEQRLRPQLELAQLRGAPQKLYAKGMLLIENLPFWFDTYQPQASLLHGDLWGGNSAFSANGTPIVFDPASYYGDREIDIAMSELFNGFSKAFYQGYNCVFPLDSGYTKRTALYQLYPLLNHFNLFGEPYAQQAQQQIQALLKQSKKPFKNPSP